MRPLDIDGQPVILGDWYWAEDRTGQLAGAGKFAATISRPDDVTFFINGTGYNPESFSRFVRCTAVPQKLLGGK